VKKSEGKRPLGRPMR